MFLTWQCRNTPVPFLNQLKLREKNTTLSENPKSNRKIIETDASGSVTLHTTAHFPGLDTGTSIINSMSYGYRVLSS